MPNRDSTASPTFASATSRASLAAAFCAVFVALSCAPATGPGAESLPANGSGGAPVEPSGLVPASGVDTGRAAREEAPAQLQLAREAAPAAADSAPPSGALDAAGVSGDPAADPVAPPGDGAAQDAPAEAPAVAPRSPLAALVAPSVAFMVNYQASGARKHAESACDLKAKDDMQKRAECLQEAREGFKADVLVFSPLGKDRHTLTIYSRTGSTLKEVFASTVELRDASEQNVTMRFVGGQRGSRPIFGGAGKVTLVLPTDSTLTIDDPKYGSLPYSAKVGLVNDR